MVAEFKEKLRVFIQKWKSGIEAKGRQYTIGKTMVMRCEVSSDKVEQSKQYNCTWSLTIRMTGYRNAGNYKLRVQNTRRKIEGNVSRLT